MWSDIVKQNREHLMVLLKEWISEMEHLYDTVSSGDAGEIQNYFADAKRIPFFTGKKERAIPAYHDLYVDVLDKVGHWLILHEYFAQKLVLRTCKY